MGFKLLLINCKIHSLVATISDSDLLPNELKRIFDRPWKDQFSIEIPVTSQRKEYFNQIEESCYTPVPVFQSQAGEILKELTFEAEKDKAENDKNESEKIEEKEESTMRTLRIFLRNIITRLAQDKRFKEFTRPVDEEEVPDYYRVIEQPMDLSTIMCKIDTHDYQTVKDMLEDITLIVDNALEYNPENYSEERMIRHRACLLKDFAFELVESELDPDFEKTCAEIKIARSLRGGSAKKHAPNFVTVEDEETETKNRELQKSLFSRLSKESDFDDSTEFCWAEHNGNFYLGKILKIKEEDDAKQFYVHYLHFNKVRIIMLTTFWTSTKTSV